MLLPRYPPGSGSEVYWGNGSRSYPCCTFGCENGPFCDNAVKRIGHLRGQGRAHREILLRQCVQLESTLGKMQTAQTGIACLQRQA